MRRILLALSFVAATVATTKAAVLVEVDQSIQRMSVAVDGVPTYSWRISTGKPGYDTPNGAFRPNRMDADHHSDEYDSAPMPHAVFFDLHGHAIHGTYEPIGRPAASHGCVRLEPANATILFDLIKKQGMANTRVEISGDVREALANMPQPAPRARAAKPAYAARTKPLALPGSYKTYDRSPLYDQFGR